MFFTTLRVKKVSSDPPTWRLLSDLIYQGVTRVYKLEVPIEVRVPAGFTTDFASVPRLPVAFLLTGDTAQRAATVHDFLYEFGRPCTHSALVLTRKQADDLFLQAMTDSGIPRWRRNMMYYAVRAFGGGAWRRYRELKPTNQ